MISHLLMKEPICTLYVSANKFYHCSLLLFVFVKYVGKHRVSPRNEFALLICDIALFGEGFICSSTTNFVDYEIEN